MDNKACEAFDRKEVFENIDDTEEVLLEHLHFKNKGNGVKRRNSSVSFNPVLEDFELVDLENQHETTEDDENNDLMSNSYKFSSSNRPSIFSRISERSFQRFSTTYRYNFLFWSLLVVFFSGLLLGAFLAKIIL